MKERIKTPITDKDEKREIIEHINDDHANDLLIICKSFTHSTNPIKAELVDVFEEGIELALTSADGTNTTVFVQTQIEGSFRERYLYLLYSAMAKQGMPLNSKTQFFEVVNSEKLTSSFVRLTLSSNSPLPKNEPGYAYGFLLKTLNKKKSYTRPWWQGYADRAFLWLMKVLSSKQRQKVIKNMGKDTRYYTLQRAWQEEGSDFVNCGFVDIFLHGETNGSNWATSLKVGDIITSRSGHEEKCDNVNTGKALLIADETAYPALLGILQNWQNPVAPIVILISEKESDQDYFSGANLNIAEQVTRIICPPNEQGERVIECITTLSDIKTVWGAFENAACKNVRMYLRNKHQLKGANNRIRGYWVLENTD